MVNVKQVTVGKAPVENAKISLQVQFRKIIF